MLAPIVQRERERERVREKERERVWVSECVRERHDLPQAQEESQPPYCREREKERERKRERASVCV